MSLIFALREEETFRRGLDFPSVGFVNVDDIMNEGRGRGRLRR